MLYPITISHPEDDIRFWSDAHIGHDRPWIVQARGFTSVREHDDALIARWNEVCTDTTVAFHLGDLTFADPEGKRFAETVRRLRFRTLYVLLGNHVSGHKQAYRALEARMPGDDRETYPLKWCVDGRLHDVVFLPQYAEVKLNGQPVVLCHYPIESWNGMAKGYPHLHGHCHGNLKRTMSRRRDVGVDCYANPPSLKRLLKDMEDERPAVVDHHGETP